MRQIHTVRLLIAFKLGDLLGVRVDGASEAEDGSVQGANIGRVRVFEVADQRVHFGLGVGIRTDSVEMSSDGFTVLLICVHPAVMQIDAGAVADIVIGVAVAGCRKLGHDADHRASNHLPRPVDLLVQQRSAAFLQDVVEIRVGVRDRR